MIVKDHNTSKPITYTIPENAGEKEDFLSGGWDTLRVNYGKRVIAIISIDKVKKDAYHPRRKILKCKENGKDYVIVKMIGAKF